MPPAMVKRSLKSLPYQSPQTWSSRYGLPLTKDFLFLWTVHIPIVKKNYQLPDAEFQPLTVFNFSIEDT